MQMHNSIKKGSFFKFTTCHFLKKVKKVVTVTLTIAVKIGVKLTDYIIKGRLKVIR